MLIFAKWLQSGWGVGVAAGIMAIGWLSAVVAVAPAYAEQDTDVPSRGATVPPEAAAAVPPPVSAVVPAKIADLFVTAERQITDGRIWSPPNDNASDTFLSVIALLPNASMADLETMRGIPSRFAQRARAAEGAGRHEEAQQFLMWAEVFATTPAVATSQIDQVGHNAPEADTAHEAGRGGDAETSGLGSAPSVPGPPSIMASRDPSQPPGTTDSDADARDADADVRGRGSMATPETGAAVPPPVAAAVPARITDLLATAEQQIADASPDNNVWDTFVSVMALRPNASIVDLQTMRETPSRLAQHARAAEAAGRHKEAQHFLRWAEVFATPLRTMTSQGDQMAPTAPKADVATPSPRAMLPGVEVMRRPTAPPHKVAGHAGSTREAERGGGGETGGAGIRQPSPSGAPPAVRMSLASSIPVKRYVPKGADEHCRAIVLKAQLGEEPSNADRAYLRQGCPHG